MIIGKTDKQLEQIICGICDNLAAEPMVTQCCGQVYCSLCIVRSFLENNLCSDCQNCHNIITPDKIKQSPHIMPNDIKVKCINRDNGCDAVLKANELDVHLKECLFKSAIVSPKPLQIKVRPGMAKVSDSRGGGLAIRIWV